MQKIGIPSTTLSSLASALSNDELGTAIRLLVQITTTRKPIPFSRLHVVGRVSKSEWQDMSDAILQHFIILDGDLVSHVTLESLALPGLAGPAGPARPESAAISLVDHTRRPNSVPKYGQQKRPEMISIKKVIFTNGVALFSDEKRSETTARSLVAGLVKIYREGDVAEAISAAMAQQDLIEPYSWVLGWLKHNRSPKPTRGSMNRSPAPPTPDRQRPLATPEFLGISPGRARAIEERNANLKLEIKKRK